MSSTSTSTSRIGRKPVPLPTGVEVKVKGNELSIKGPKGHLTVDVHEYVSLKMADNAINIELKDSDDFNITGQSRKLFRAIAGTQRANIFNAIHGVTVGYVRELQLIGVGYRAAGKGKILGLSLGFSHPTDYVLPEGVTAETPTQTQIILKGANKELVGQAAAEIRAIRSPEPYKGKGVRYLGENIELKETKKK